VLVRTAFAIEPLVKENKPFIVIVWLIIWFWARCLVQLSKNIESKVKTKPGLAVLPIVVDNIRNWHEVR